MKCSLIARVGVLSTLSLAPAAYSQDEASAPEPAATEETKESPATLRASDQTSETISAQTIGKRDFVFGPHVAVGIPHPLTAGVDIVYADLIGLSFSAGRSGTEIDSTDIEIRSWDVGVSWFPFGGSFFIGALFGDQGVVGKRTIDLDVDASGVPLKVPTTLRLEIESKYLTPHIGWFARWDSGFTLGFDLGVQLPSSSSSNLQTSFANVSAASEASVRESADYKKNKKDVEDAAELIGKKAIPYINLIKLAWLF